MPPSTKNMGAVRAAKIKQEYDDKMKLLHKDWKQDDTVEEASTTYSEFSNAEVMMKIKAREKNKSGKKLIPTYLKEDFPDHAMLPCK